MHEEDVDKVQHMPVCKSTCFRVTASGEPILVPPTSDAPDVDSGENSGEPDAGEPAAGKQDSGRDAQAKESPIAAQHKALLGPKHCNASNMAKTCF